MGHWLSKNERTALYRLYDADSALLYAKFDGARWSKRFLEAPVWVRVAELIRVEVLSGSWRPGQRIPSLKILAAAAGCSISPVSKVVGLLQQEGLLVLCEGEGIFVPSLRERMSSLAGWSGYVYGKRIRSSLHDTV